MKLSNIYSVCLFVLGTVALPQNRANAAIITWTAPANISSNTDVNTNGLAVYAYDWSGGNATVNGVSFSGSTSFSVSSGNVLLDGFGANTTNAYSSSASPYAALSSVYKTVLQGGDYATSGNTAVTVTLNNLVVGNVYNVQIWVNDPRGPYNSRTETLATTGGNTITLDYSTADGTTAGGSGQCTIGSFQADNTMQTFTLLGAASTQLNALQVRNITGLSGSLYYSSLVTVVSNTTLQLTQNGLLTNSAVVVVNTGGSIALSNGVNETVQSLCLGGQWEPDGTWGSSSSAAANQNNTYFSGSGIITVSHGTQVQSVAPSPLFSLYGIREYNGFAGPPSQNPDSNSISYTPMPGHDYLPTDGHTTQTYDVNFNDGLPTSAFFIEDTYPLPTNTNTYGTYMKSNAIPDTLNYFVTNAASDSPATAMSLNYVFADFEIYYSSDYAQEIQKMASDVVAARTNAILSNTLVGSYAVYPGATPSSLGSAREATDGFYRSSGLDVAQPNLYSYSGYNDNGPNARAGYFWSCLELASIAKQNLPAGHQLIPWAELSLNGGALSGNTTNTWGDGLALYAQLRLRGVDGWATQDPNIWWFAWTDLNWLFYGVGNTQVLNLGTDESSGFQWSGFRVGGNVGFMFSNLGSYSTNFPGLPNFPGVPSSVTVPIDTDLAWYFANDPAGLATNHIILGRDGVDYGFFVNNSVTLTNAVQVVAPGTNDVPALVTIGSNLTNSFSPTFAGPLTLSNNVILQGTTSSTIFAGVISGSGGITNVGFVTLSNTNGYSGGTTIASGVLQIQNACALGNGTVSIPKSGASSGTLQLALTGVNTISNTFNGFNSADAFPTGTADIENISGNNTVLSALTVAGSGGNGINIQSDSGTGNFLTLAGTIDNLSAATYRIIDLGGNGSGLVSGAIQATDNSLGVSKDGLGTWTLTANNTFNRAVLINAGTLALSGSGSLADSPNVIIAGGATFDVSGLSSTFTLGSSQMLTGTGATGTINGNANLEAGSLEIDYTNGMPTLAVTGGTLTFSNNSVTVTVMGGTPLATGSYQLISSGVGGLVSTSPTTVNGAGVVDGASASLNISNSALYLVVTDTPSLQHIQSANITGVTLSGSGLIITGTNLNGGQNFHYEVLSTTNLTLPPADWTILSTNSFNADGTFDYTNPVNSTGPAIFFNVKIVQ